MILDPLRECAVGSWSAAVHHSGRVLDSLDGHVRLPTASVGKVFLLLAVAEGIVAGELDPDSTLAPEPDDVVADSGVLQWFGNQRQTVADLALLVAAVSDNLATNVLLRRVGLDAVEELTARVGATECGLHDFVRDERQPARHPPFLSTGCADELAAVMSRLAVGELVSPAVSNQVRAWLSTNTDLSMVAAAFSLDPLAHASEDLGVTLASKTGTNVGTRADIGLVTAGRPGERTMSYAVIARWSADDHERRTAVLDAMRSVGANLRAELLAG